MSPLVLWGCRGRCILSRTFGSDKTILNTLVQHSHPCVVDVSFLYIFCLLFFTFEEHLSLQPEIICCLNKCSQFHLFLGVKKPFHRINLHPCENGFTLEVGENTSIKLAPHTDSLSSFRLTVIGAINAQFEHHFNLVVLWLTATIMFIAQMRVFHKLRPIHCKLSVEIRNISFGRHFQFAVRPERQA